MAEIVLTKMVAGMDDVTFFLKLKTFLPKISMSGPRVEHLEPFDTLNFKLGASYTPHFGGPLSDLVTAVEPLSSIC